MLDATYSVSPAPHAVSTASPQGSQPARQMQSNTLFDGAREVRIDHYGQEYRLRQTRNGKLILTK